MPHVLITAIRPGVTDVRTIGQHEAVTDHTRVLEDGRHCGYAVQYSAPIGPERPPMIVVYETEYQWSGDEGDQTAEGDYEGAIRRVFPCVPDQWDVEDGKTSVDLAVEVLNDLPAYLEPDCVPGVPNWFCGTDENSTDRHFRTGAWDEYSAHLYGFTDDERTRIGQLYSSR